MKVHSTLAVVALFSVTFCIATAVSAALAPPKSDVRPEEFSQALDDYKDGKRTAAYGQFARLADRGDAESARMALILLRHGQKLHGTAWGASQPQIDHWMKLARGPMPPLVAESGD